MPEDAVPPHHRLRLTATGYASLRFPLTELSGLSSRRPTFAAT
jgi:hypothetical protein